MALISCTYVFDTESSEVSAGLVLFCFLPSSGERKKEIKKREVPADGVSGDGGRIIMAHGASSIHHQREQWCVCDGDHACVGAGQRTAGQGSVALERGSRHPRWVTQYARREPIEDNEAGDARARGPVGPSAAAATRARAHDDDDPDPGASGRYCRPARAHRGRALPPPLSRKRQGVGDVRRERRIINIKYGPGFAFCYC